MSKKTRKSTMVELVNELQKLPQSTLRDQVIAEAKAGEFHDYKNEKYICGKVAVVGYLRKLDANALAEAVMNGEYDEEPDDEDNKMFADLIKEMAKGL